ncbi:calcium-binding protein [Histidinibacterium lentulum]|nr:calcium-binding protein [Histidinibacterium lentulum]
MTLTIDLSTSQRGVDMAQLFKLQSPLNGTIADTMNFRAGPFVVRWRELASVDGEGNRTFSTVSFPVGPALEDIYFWDTLASPPSRTSLPVYSDDLGEVFYLKGAFPEPPKIEDFVRTTIYADFEEQFQNREAAISDLRSFGDALNSWVQNVLTSVIDRIEFPGEAFAGQAAVTLRFSGRTTVNDLGAKVAANTVASFASFDEITFRVDDDALFGQAVEIIGTRSDDRLFGGAFDDVISGGLGNDRIFGGFGSDSLYGGIGQDTIFGGEGDDFLFGGVGTNRLYGDAGNDAIFSGAGGSAYGGAGDDDIFGGVGLDRLYGGTGNDRIDASFFSDTVYGGAGADSISGGGGNDRLFGDSGSDRLDGNAGNDTLRGNAGSDILDGGIGADLLDGGAGADIVFGKGGNDTISGGDGFDRLEGNAGNDVISGNNGNDLIFGGQGFDRLDGGLGADRIFGGSGFDQIFGRGGNDRLLGGSGNDRLFGNAGPDLLDGGSGDDTLTGGLGADRFVFRKGYGQDRITDMEENDIILLGAASLGIASKAQISGLITDIGGSWRLDFGGGDMLTVTKLAGGMTLDASDFTFI